MFLGETIFSAFLQALFQQLMTPGVVSAYLKLFDGENLPNTIKKCKGQLTFMETMLRSAEQKQIDDEVVRPLKEDLQDIALDLEDILDELATQAHVYELEKMDQEDDNNDHQLNTTDHVSHILGASTDYMVKNIIGRAAESVSTLFNPIASISSRLDGITERLYDLQKQIKFSGLSAIHAMPQQTHQAESSQPSRETSSVLGKEEVYGRENRKNEIIQQLLEEDQQSSENYVVIPIVGMGGIGKTTLAQYVYNNKEQVKGHFDLKAWVCVSDVFDVKRITIEIITSATSQTFDSISLNQAQEKLKQVLTGKKFLIVLDDVWCEIYAEWHQLQAPFQDGAKGSRVIMTTRNEMIAMMMIKDPIHGNVVNLETLSNEDSWHLFQQHAGHNPDLVNMQDDIIEKCKGLPLAVKTLAGLLKCTRDKMQRQEILDSSLWSQKSDLLPALMLSYRHLPPHLKHIFAYMSITPKDYKFSEEFSVSEWMAQGFLTENKTSRMEDIGHNYFLDLVSRSLIEKDRGNLFTMHDLIHDLAQWAAGDLCCIIGPGNMPRDLKRTRHLSITKYSSYGTLTNQLSASQLRTFRMFGHNPNIEILDFLQKFQYVRCLRLDLDLIEELPECIGGLKQLRLISIRAGKLKVLPKSISRLFNLQTLNLGLCCNLEEVPHVGFLVKLRQFYIRITSLKEMPLGIGSLISLQDLDRFVLGAQGGARIRELRKLNHLHGKLAIIGLENVIRVGDAEEAQLHKKHDLDELDLIWNNVNDCSGRDVSQQDEVDENTISGVLEQLQPPSSIKKCMLDGYRGLKLTSWLGDVSLKNMVDIKLVNCTRCERLPPLGNLPLLTYLKVEGMEGIKQVGEEFYGAPSSSVPFKALRGLSFMKIKNWEKWTHSPVDNNRAFPCLEHLLVKDCESLQGDLPPHMPSLKMLKIETCKDLSISLPSLPLLEELKVDRCRVLSTSADVIFCSKMMNLSYISEIVGFPGYCPHLRGELDVLRCHFLSTIAQIPTMFRQVKIRRCDELKSVEFEISTSSSCPKKLEVVDCKSLVAITKIPLTLRILKIVICKKLEVVEFHKLDYSSSSSSSVGSRGEAASDEVASISMQDSAIPLTQPPSQLAYLIKLSIYKCTSLVSLPPSLLLPALKELELWDCENMEDLPGDGDMHNFSSLEELIIRKCPKIQCFPGGGLPKNLKIISIQEVNIKQQPVQEWELHLLHSLQYLQLVDVGSCADSAEFLSLPSSLSELHISGFQNLKSFLGDFTSLENLSLVNCPKFCYFSETGFFPRNLSELSISNYIEKPIRESGLHLLTSLQDLELINVEGSSIIDDTVECIPGPDLYLPSSLSELWIKGFSNLKTICCSTLPNMTEITIWSCPKFESFGNNGLPPHLKSVYINQASDLIEQHLERDSNGPIRFKGHNYSLR
ncbi:putative disease resistance RPP13-like protein 1 [Beta vulgaris subsp. vulgaris]|uniref:putative disease resistance RPP13-like protein 1 n=1 Tax=Beta vulgaris subsp. vulgaris TaxID=3555 RepID=UPI0025479FD3|nr:putative disease resistance RPP13-like protein 1 [Beta vulgaris subsp. vulgaris]